jgi:hypothetical protein
MILIFYFVREILKYQLLIMFSLDFESLDVSPISSVKVYG